jgi:hypothetical protein
MAPCDFWLFSTLSSLIKGSDFDSHEYIIQNATAQLHTIPKQAFQMCFLRWKDRWRPACKADNFTAICEPII